MARTFRNLFDEAESKRYASDILTWIHEAGNPYYDWFFGGYDSAHRILGKWMTRPSSELSITRMKVLFDNDRALGLFLGLSGDELLSCRKADMLALMKERNPDDVLDLSERFSAARDLFPRVGSDTYYLSKMGVSQDLRGEGLGREILREFIVTGREAGFNIFQIDVSVENQQAIRLYESHGFRVTHRSSFAKANLEYISMVLEEMG